MVLEGGIRGGIQCSLKGGIIGWYQRVVLEGGIRGWY